MVSVVLEVDKLIIKPFTQDDFTLYMQRGLYPEINKHMSHFESHDIAKSFERTIHRWKEFGFGRFAVFQKTEDEDVFIGSSGFEVFYNPSGFRNPLPYSESWHKYGGDLELSHWYLPDYWGGGIATKVGKAVCAWAFKNFDTERIVAVTNPDNIPSKKSLQKMGFQFIKTVDTPEYEMEDFFALYHE